MESLKPLLRALQKNLDRVAIVVFVGLTLGVIYLWQSERTQDAPRVTPVPPSSMPEMLPSSSYEQVLQNLSWGGQIYARRPLDEDHPFVDNIRVNLFAERAPPTEADIRREVSNTLRQAEQAHQAAQATSDPVRRRELLEQTIRHCDRIITVWSAISGAEQGDARALRDQAQAELDQLEAAGAGT